MKTSKRISALLLAMCLLAGMAVPMVSAEATTVTYDFDATNIADANKITFSGTTTYLVNTGTVLAEMKAQNLINWQFKATTITTANYALFSPNGYVYGRAGGKGYIAFEIDNPGKGTYELSVNHAVSGNGADGIGVYILPGNTATDQIVSLLTEDTCKGTYTCYSASETKKDYNTQNIGHNSKLESTWEVKDDNSYIVVFRLDSYPDGKSRIYLSQLILTPVAEEATNVAQVGNAMYTDVQKAIEAAAADSSTAVLLDNVTVDGTLTVTAGATLDLAGKKLEADSVTVFGTVKDSTNGGGLLAVNQNTDENTYLTLREDNEQLPLYDATGETKGYRFFTCELTSLKPVSVNEGVAQQFWFKLTLNKTAYDLIKEGGTGLSVMTALTWNGNKIQINDEEVDNFVFRDDTVKNWAKGMADEKNYGFYLTVTGFAEAGEGTLVVTPKLESAGVAFAAANAMEYAN